MTNETMEDQSKRLADELENLQEIGQFLNPSPGEIPKLDGVDIYAVSMPLHGVLGGDHTLFIDFNHRYDLDRRVAEAKEQGRPKVAKRLERLRHRAGILVADASGHRMTDAMTAAMLHQAFLLGVHYELDIYGEITTRIFEQINTRFYRTNSINKYVTMIYGEIVSDGKFRFLSAGHGPPSVFSREYGHFVKISPERLVSFTPVGMLPSSDDPDDRVNPPGFDRYMKHYEVNEIDLLAVGDILLLHTDGLTEHAEGSYYPGRLERLLAGAGNASAKDLCARIRRDLLAAAEPEDDISFVVIRKTG